MAAWSKLEGIDNTMEGDVDNDGFDSDEDWPEPIDEPRETQYLIVKNFRCKAR